MKKAISLLLALVMCLSLDACGNNNEDYSENSSTPLLASENSASQNDSSSNTTSDSNSQDYVTYDGNIVLTEEAMMSYFEVIVLSENNWRDYWTIENIDGMLFLCLKDTVAFAYTWWNPNNPVCENTIEFIHEATGETIKTQPMGTWDGDTMVDYEWINVGSEVSAQDLRFVSSEGKLVLFHIPEEYWNTNSDGKNLVEYGVVEGGNGWATFDGGWVIKGSRAHHGNMNEMIKSYLS